MDKWTPGDWWLVATGALFGGLIALWVLRGIAETYLNYRARKQFERQADELDELIQFAKRIMPPADKDGRGSMKKDPDEERE